MFPVSVSFYGPNDRLHQQVTIGVGQMMMLDVPPWSTVMKIVVAHEPVAESPVVSDDPSSFRDAVLEWLQTELDETVVSVEKVTGSGTDWGGDTASGFYSEEYIEIDWTDATGRKRNTEVRGDDFVQLWGRLVGSALRNEGSSSRAGAS